MEIQVTRAEKDLLLIALGMAIGTAFNNGDRRLAYEIVALTNAIGSTFPGFCPYEIPPEFQRTK